MWGHVESKISIPEFYQNKNVFITGAAGFIGKLLVEKLLRSCSGIKNIYVLIRPKYGKSPQDRLSNAIDDPLFDTIKMENSDALNKIIPISGDIEQINLGLSEKDKATIIENVTIIFHCAASIRFDDSIKMAIFTNIRSAREITSLAKELKKIDVFVDVSTAYSNCDRLIVEEKLYPAKINWRDLIRLAEEYDETTLNHLLHKLIYPMPNTYVFTKAIAEHAVVEQTKNKIPAVILRPSIVCATHSDPVPGWLDNINGTAGMLWGIAKGVIRAAHSDENVQLDHVFADSVVKALIIASWKKALSGNTNEVHFYNLASDIMIHVGNMEKLGIFYLKKKPLSSYLWPPQTKTHNSNYYKYYFLALLRQVLPAIFIDTLLIISRRKPMLWKINRKIFVAMSCMAPFSLNTWIFKNENYMELRKSILPEDSQQFSIVNFGSKASIKKHNECLNIYFDGILKYYGKEPPVTEAMLFDTIRKENCGALNKLVPISGDVEKVNFGLSKKDKATIIENVTIIFHAAASIHFDDHIKKAVITNTRSAREITLLARQLKKIDVFVSVSTAFSNCDRLIVEEKLYPPKMNWRDLIQLAEECDETTLQNLMHKIIYPMPNTYVFTKALGEHAVVDLAKDKIPAIIMRPTIVYSTLSDPIPGWIDNINGTAGVLYGVSKGVIRTLWSEKTAELNHVFADSVAKALIIGSWKKALSCNTNEVGIYNVASDINVQIGHLIDSGIAYVKKNPSQEYLWPPNAQQYSSYYAYYFFVLLKNILPVILIDILLILSGRQPMLWKVHRKIFLSLSFLAPFMHNRWIFKIENYMELSKSILQEDSKQFSIVHFGPKVSIKKVNEILLIYYNGIRQHFVKDAPPTEAMIKKQARKHLKPKTKWRDCY